MLAKQVWRLYQFPESLCSRVFKAKYYPSSDVLNAGSKQKASYVWQSFMEGRKILMKGLAWRVGNGQSVMAKSDNWITTAGYMKPVGAVNLLDECRVSFFIDEENKRWNENRVKQVFSEDDAANILQIPISYRLPPDRIFWPHNKMGIFTVKSAYYLADNSDRSGAAGTSNGNGRSEVWHSIWRLAVPPKVKHFLWRVGHGSLACNVNLAKRNIPVSGFCPRCQASEETVLHCLKECEEVRGMWLGSPLSLRVDRYMCRNAYDWLNIMFSSLKGEEAQIFAMVLWQIWNDRNALVFDNPRLPLQVLFSSISSMLSTVGARLRSRVDAVVKVNKVWVPPPPNVLKINSDAAISVEKGLAVLSAVCRDDSGSVIRCGVSFLKGCTIAETAEAKAVLFGLYIARSLNYNNLICETDALNVANRLCNPRDAADYLQMVVEDCHAEGDGRQVSFVYANRDCNLVAHALAKWGLFFGRDCIFDGSVPFPVNELVTV